MATTDVLAGTPFSINTLPIKASPTPKPAPAPTTVPDLEAQELEAYKQKGQLAELKDEAVLRKEKETAEAQAKTTADYAKAVTEDPTRKLLGEKVKERADTTFVPTKETAADMGLLFTLTNIVGFMIGGKSKGNAQQAMSAMNGMLEGHQKGREDLYKKEKAIFEENTKALDKTIEALDRQFKEAMQIYAVDREAGMAKAQSAIAEHNATFLGDALKKNGLAYSADLLSKAVAQKDKKELAMQTLKNREEDIKRQERHQKEIERQGRERLSKEAQGTLTPFVVKGEDGKEKTMLFNNRTGAVTESTVNLAGAKKVGVKEKMVEASELGGNALLKEVIGKTAKTDKIAGDINSNAMAVSRIDNLLTRLQDPEIRSGVQSKLSTIREQAKSLFGEQGEMSPDQINSLINGVVNPTDKNAVFQKDALFTAFEAERAAQGGRLTVQMMKQAGSVLDPTNYTKEGYAGVLGGRRQTLVNNLRSQNLNDSDVGKLTNHFAKDQPQVGGVQTPSETTKKMPSQEKLQAYADAHAEFGGDVEKARNHLYGLGYR